LPGRHLRCDLDGTDDGARLRHREPVGTQSFEMEGDRLADQSLHLLARATADKDRKVRRVWAVART
jgi:hypothetical protein